MSPKGISDNLFFSEIFGGGIYRWNGRFADGTFGCSDGEESPLLTHVTTGETYYTKWIDADGGTRSYYQQLILSPPQCLDILWPSDMIRVPDARAELFRLSLAQNYLEATPVSRTGERAVLLFSCAGTPTAAERSGWTGSYSWKDPALRKIAGRLIEIFDRLNRAGYIYQDFHLSRFFFGCDGRVLLNFSNLIFPLGWGSGLSSSRVCTPAAGEFPLEFAQPAFVQGKKPWPDFRSQNYSLGALLFFLFLGRHAYEGALMTGRLDRPSRQRFTWLRDYHRMPIFIFDPEDRSNHIGEFQEEQTIVELWEQLPESLKDAFLMTLRQDHADGSKRVCFPTPATWLRLMEQLGWYP